MRFAAIFSVTACVLSGAAGCATMPPPQWHSTPPLAKPRDAIFRSMEEALQKEGFEAEERDAAAGTIASRWRVILRPHWREGRRERVEMRLEPLESGGWIVRIRTVRELNDNSKDPMAPASASWIEGGGNDDLSRRIAFMLRMKVNGMGMDE